MKIALNRWMSLGCALLLGATAWPAQAFYNPATGRWLSRDPLYEFSFALDAKVADQLMEVEDALGGLFCFAWNNAVDGWDYLGLKEKARPWRECKAPKEWKQMIAGGRVPPVDGCSVPKAVTKIFFPPDGNKDDPTGKCSFQSACNQHDRCYSNCAKTKEECDDDWLKDMKKACDDCYNRSTIIDKRAKESIRRDCYAWAETYYKAVSAAAENAYMQRQLKNCECVCTKCPNPSFCPHPDK